MRSPLQAAVTECHFEWRAQQLPSSQLVHYSISVPNRQSPQELVSLLSKRFNLPPSVRPDLLQAVSEFLTRETAAHHARQFEAAWSDFAAVSDDTLEQMADQWETAFTSEAEGPSVTDELVFSHAYHNLIHSNALQTLLNLEQQCSRAVGDLIEDRDKAMEGLERRQEAEMQTTIAQAGSRFSDEEISHMAQRQWEDKQLEEVRWASELEHMKRGQRQEYRDFVVSVHERTETMEEDLTNFVRPPMNEDDDEERSEEGGSAPWEESFTIVLGKQLKTTHHFRLLRADILDFCSDSAPSAQRLNTAMGLYSDRLSGLVLLVDNRLNTFSGVKREFARVCERATEFHFPELHEQFERISLVVQAANDRRTAMSAAGNNSNGHVAVSTSRMKSVPSLDSDLSNCPAADEASLRSWTSFDSSPRLQVGDVYITRHSNLADAHVVFHLVADDSIYDASLSSTSPVVRGLSNIFRACFQHDVTKLTLPLLLVHHTSEEMTSAWCTRRVDMVYKAVKAGIIEGSTWMSRESRVIQMAVPTGISDDMLESFSEQLPSVFHLANPVKG